MDLELDPGLELTPHNELMFYMAVLCVAKS